MKCARSGRGFTFVELLVGMAIVVVLLALLLPAMFLARQASHAVRCASNLRLIGQGLGMYAKDCAGALPQGFVRLDDHRYSHWSASLVDLKLVRASSFTCPALDYGGHPPTNPSAQNFDPGQVAETSGVIDHQAPRVAFTLNQPLAGMRVADVSHPASTILATEFTSDWRVFSDAEQSGEAVGGAICRSHRSIAIGSGSGWIGANHGSSSERRSTFLYVDGHIESKPLEQTIVAGQWERKAMVARAR